MQLPYLPELKCQIARYCKERLSLKNIIIFWVYPIQKIRDTKCFQLRGYIYHYLGLTTVIKRKSCRNFQSLDNVLQFLLKRVVFFGYRLKNKCMGKNMVCGAILGSLVLILWLPCIKQGTWTQPGPVYARDRKNRVFQITPTGQCCETQCQGK